MPKPVALGLHITKCAGTSLASAVRRTLPPKAWYISSEFVSNQNSGIMEISERSNLDEVRFVFGHYIHQSLLPIFAHRKVILFTGIREPMDRAVSEYYHMCRVQLRHGKEPFSAQDFLDVRSDTICAEVLRAFPAGHSNPGNLADKAWSVLKIFNLIYSSSDLEQSVRPLGKMLGLPEEPLPVVNERRVDNDYEGYLAEQVGILREKIPTAFKMDCELYEKVRPRIGKWRNEKTAWKDRWNDRPNSMPDWLGPVMADQDPMHTLQAHHAKYLVNNYANAGRIDDIRSLVRQKRSFLDLLEEQMGLTAPQG